MSGNSPGYNPGLSSHGSHGWDGDQIETTISVPAGKCGVIIGKGTYIPLLHIILFIYLSNSFI